jgi:hypothetical protein
VSLKGVHYSFLSSERIEVRGKIFNRLICLNFIIEPLTLALSQREREWFVLALATASFARMTGGHIWISI